MEEYSKNPIKWRLQLIGDLLWLAGYHVEASTRWFFAWLSRWIMTHKLALALAVGVTLIALLLWPTLYRYDHIEVGAGRSYPVRQNRITGQTEILFPEGWKEAKDSTAGKTSNLKQEVSPDQLEKLEIHAILKGVDPPTGWDRLEGDIYNGLPDVEINEITVEINVVNSKNEAVVTSRPYRISLLYGVGAQPLQTAHFSTRLGFNVLPTQSWTFRLVGAKATKSSGPSEKPSVMQ